MKVALLVAIPLFALMGCGGDSAPSPEQALQNPPTIFGVGISISEIPLEHEVQPILFVEFARPVEASDRGQKNMAHPEFFMPLGTVVTAVSNGRVRSVEILEHEDDMLILVTPDDATDWTIGYEHVSNVRVTAGDRIQTGDILADLAPEQGEFFQGFGKTSIMIFVDSNTSAPPFTYCPFLLLDESVRQSIYDEIDTHVTLWEQNKGDTSLFEEEKWHSPGCYLESLNG